MVNLSVVYELQKLLTEIHEKLERFTSSPHLK